jgi:hypothetical protein
MHFTAMRWQPEWLRPSSLPVQWPWPASELSSCSSSANRGVTIPNHFRAKLILREHSPWSSTLKSWAVTCIMIFFSSANHWRWQGSTVISYNCIILFLNILCTLSSIQVAIICFYFLLFSIFFLQFLGYFFLFLFHPKDYNPTIILDISFLWFPFFFWY